MSTETLSKIKEAVPFVPDDFFRPWNELFEGDVTWNRNMQIPAVNITEEKNEFLLSMAAPGLKKADFKIGIDGNMLTISHEKKENKEKNNSKFTRKEYSYSSFSRSFTLPEEINKEKVEATYDGGLLKISLPRKAEPTTAIRKQIGVK